VSALLISFLVGVGLLTGILSAVLGVGGGIFMVPALVLVVGLDQHEAQATSLLVIIPTATMATVSLRRRQIGNPRLSLVLGVFGVAGSVAGAATALALSGQTLRYAFATLLTVVGVRLLFDARRMTRAESPTTGAH